VESGDKIGAKKTEKVEVETKAFDIEDLLGLGDS